jgi:beta-N-acetylhexosaminidase
VLNISLQTSEVCTVGKSFYDMLDKKYRNTLRLQMTPKSNELNFKFALQAAEKAAIVVVSCYADVRAFEGKFGLDVDQAKFLKRLIDATKTKGVPLVLMSFGTPYLIMEFPDAPVYLCTYGGVRVSETAALKVITGEIDPKGKLPITIPKLFKLGDGLQHFTPKESPAAPQ